MVNKEPSLQLHDKLGIQERFEDRVILVGLSLIFLIFLANLVAISQTVTLFMIVWLGLILAVVTNVLMDLTEVVLTQIDLHHLNSSLRQ